MQRLRHLHSRTRKKTHIPLCLDPIQGRQGTASMVRIAAGLPTGRGLRRSGEGLSRLDRRIENWAAAQVSLVAPIPLGIYGSRISPGLGLQSDRYTSLSMVWEEGCIYGANRNFEGTLSLSLDLAFRRTTLDVAFRFVNSPDLLSLGPRPLTRRS